MNQDLLKVTQTFYLPIFTYAMMIERQFGEFLNPPRPGIYRVGDIYPCIEPTKLYYAQKINKNNTCTTTPITDFNLINDTVTDEIGNVIIPAAMMRSKEQYLRNEPTVPVRGLILIELLIKKYLDSVATWVKHSMQNQKIVSNIKPEYHEIYWEGHLEKITESLILQVSDFIGHDTWHLYFVKLLGLDLVIEKTSDYRVITFHQKMDSGEWS